MAAAPCSDESCDHMPTVVYTRPWRRLWRKTFLVRCWMCDLKIQCWDEFDARRHLFKCHVPAEAVASADPIPASRYEAILDDLTTLEYQLDG